MVLLRPFAWLAALLLFLVAILTLFALTFDANRYKPELVALVKQETGRELQIDGDIHLSFYPNIALTLAQLSLSNAKGFTAEPFATAKQARMEVQLLPLLEQQLKINEVHLQGLTLNLHRNKSGKTNWADLLPAGSSKANADAGEAMSSLLGGFVISGVSVQDSQVHWRDEQHNKHLTLRDLTLQTGTFHPAQPVTLRLNTTLTQTQPNPLSMVLTASTTAQLAADKDNFTLQDLQLQAQLAQQGEVSLSGNLQGKLSTQQLSIPDLQVTSQAQLPHLGEMRAQLQGSLQTNLRSGKGLLDFPQVQVIANGQPLSGTLQVRDPLNATREVNGSFHAEQLRYPPFTLQQATLGVAFAKEQLHLTPQGNLFQGQYQGKITLDTQQTPLRLRSEHQLQQVRSEALWQALTGDKLLTGALDLRAKLDSVLGDTATFQQNLHGSIDFSLNDGTIRAAQFAENAKQVVQLLAPERVNEVGATEVAFSKLSGQWRIQQGVFSTADTTLLAPQFQVQGNGEVKPLTQSLDLKLRIAEKADTAKPNRLFAPLHIHGAWDKPSYALELDVLLKELAKRALDKRASKLEGLSATEKQQLRDQLSDELKGKLGDELKDKLKGLF